MLDSHNVLFGDFVVGEVDCVAKEKKVEWIKEM
jgi:hypothetical protein